mmetsp:Transcript_10233/g.22146  ORF Transcript_10233/g.22146 Transcript_10233/m.22146 type:complete len:527 (-) Transcript_10233:75-1655(-)
MSGASSGHADDELDGEGAGDAWEDEYCSEKPQDVESKKEMCAFEVDGFDCGDEEQLETSVASSISPPASIRRLLVISHLFGRSAEVVFQFIVVIFLTKCILSDSLLLVSSYGLFSSLLVVFLGGKAGSFLDDSASNNRRLRSLQVVLLGQYGCVVACSGVCYLLLNLYDLSTDPLDLPVACLLVAIHGLGGFSLLCSEASTIAIEKDWIIVISGNDVDYLGALNVTLRQIDLGCKMLGPAAAGFFLMAVGEQIQPAIVAVGIVNVISFFAEYCFLTTICRAVPALMLQNSNFDSTEHDGGTDGGLHAEKTVETKKHCARCILLSGLSIYFQQDIAAGGFALSLLYLNVLSVGELMTSYLIWRGLSLHLLGIWRGVASIIGLLGTALYGWWSSRMSLQSTSMWSITFFLVCLTVSFTSLFVPNNNDTVTLAMLMMGVTASRVGLWSFDLSVSQLIQLTVPQSCRGIVGGTQHSLQNLFFALHFVLGLVWSDPSQFHILMTVGYSAVATAFLLVMRGVYFSRQIDVHL